MLSHPAFFSAEVRSDSESKALFAEQNVSAVTRVDRPNGVLFREVNDITVFFVKVCLCMKTLDEVGAVTELVEASLAGTGHDKHIEHDIDRVGKLNTDLREIGAEHAHGIRDNVHGLAAHRAFI